MNLSHATNPDVNPQIQPPELSYADGYVYRAVWFSRFGKGRFPNATTFNAGRLLMIVNGYRDKDGRTPIRERQLRRALTALRNKGYITFRSKRRRRKPTAESFRRATYVECLVSIEEIRYLERGRHQNMTHLLPRTVKCPLAATPRKKAVHGHEVTNSPQSNKKESQVPGPKAKKPPSVRATFPPRFSQNHIEAEKLLTSYAEQISEAVGQPWEPLKGKLTWRLGAIVKTLGPNVTDEELWDYVPLVVGMALKRSEDIERSALKGEWEPFWEISHGDVVVRALAVERTGNDAEWAACLRASGNRFLGNLERQEEVRREAKVGTRDDQEEVQREVNVGTQYVTDAAFCSVCDHLSCVCSPERAS